MISKKDREDIRDAKTRIKAQVEDTKKLDLGLDADKSAKHPPHSTSNFEGFIDEHPLPPLEDK